MLISLDTLKDYLKITNTQDDDILTANIKAATQYIQNYTWRSIELKDYTDIRDWQGERELILKDFPIKTLSSYQNNTWSFWVPIWSDFDVNNYALNKEQWIIRSLFQVPRWFQNIKIVYQAWYDVVPEDIQYACIKIATLMYTWAWKLKQNIKKESLDWASVEYDLERQGLEREIFLILDNYKMKNV